MLLGMAFSSVRSNTSPVSQIFRGPKGEKAIFVEFSRKDCLAEGKIVLPNNKEKTAPSPGLRKELPDFTPSGKGKASRAGFRPGECGLLSCRGFSEEEKLSLEKYLKENQEEIVRMARGVDAMRAFMGKQ